MTSTLVIIPAFNEEGALPAVLDELSTIVPAFDVLVVDDGSADRTADIAVAGGATVVSQPYNMGIGAALRTGFRYAHRNGYDRAVQFDADGQHDAAELAALVAPLDRGVSMAIGSRFRGADGDYEVSRTRGLAMQILRWLVSSLLGREFTDTSSGFRAFDRRTIELFARSYPREYMDSTEALLQAGYAGLRIEEVPVRMRERAAGVPSNRSFKLAYHYLRLLLLVLLTISMKGRRAGRMHRESTSPVRVPS
jgi:glycosyltransferase involved in cell wall biosynthesis